MDWVFAYILLITSSQTSYPCYCEPMVHPDSNDFRLISAITDRFFKEEKTAKWDNGLRFELVAKVEPPQRGRAAFAVV